MSNRSPDALRKIRSVADYQFGRGAGERLFPDNVSFVFSKKTGKMKYVLLSGSLLATLKPTDGLFSLTIEGARRLIENVEPKRLWVCIQDEAVAFVEKGSDAFARHIISADEEIRPREEVIVLDRKNRVVAVGRAVCSGREMKDLKRGVAVKVRGGSLQKVKKEKETIVTK